MKISRILIIFLSFSLLIACSKDTEIENPNNTPKAVKFQSTISGLQTKATGSTWENQDEIGVFMKKAGQSLSATMVVDNVSNKRYETISGNGVFTPLSGNSIYYPSNGSFVDFVAYHPYKSTLSDLNIPVDVTNQSSQSAIDLLYSNNATNLNKDVPTASLAFSHQLSKMVFNVTAGTGVSSLNGLTITISGMKTKGTFSLIDGSLTTDNTSGTGITAKISANGNDMLGEAIVIPVSDLNGAIITFTLPTAGTFTWDIPSNTDYNKGHKYTYDVELKKTDGSGVATIINASIVDWVTGSTEHISIEKNPGEPGGDGTYANPYTVNQLSSKAGESAKWIEGYVVGVVNGSSITALMTKAAGFTPPFTVNTNILIAVNPSETNVLNCIPVELVSGSTIQASLNLADNPSLLNKKIKIQGTIKSVLLGAPVGVVDVTSQEGGVNTSYGWFETPAKRSIDNTMYVLHYLPDKTNVRNYSMLYDTKYKLAYWVAYPMHSSYMGSSGRTDEWDYDPKINQSYQPLLASGFSASNTDRGHQIPSADRTYSKAGNYTTFYYSNMTAQNSQLNQGIWASLENKIRTWTQQCDTLYVVTGAMITTNTDKTITYVKDNANKDVARPKYYYKALAKKIGNNYYTIGYKMNNEKPSSSSFDTYRIKVSELEKETGFTFFPNLPNSTKETIDTNMWK